MERRRIARANGVGLVEILVAMLLLGIGLTGLFALQARGLGELRAASLDSQVSIQLAAMMERLRADPGAALGSGGFRCSAMGQAGAVDEWVAGLQRALGRGDRSCGAVACGGGDCTVRIRWDDRISAQPRRPGAVGPLVHERILRGRL